ncbi:MAG: protein-L-isoaspartate(D-aspartate) O-methyltransferase [Chitinophagaceae bacterium]|nr:protein-L-isoaspartate(D-aspartate) O-methyltransferase [Chitinophagaceae bacterium]
MRRREIDTPLDKGRRKRLVDVLKEKGITSQQVLNAINHIPRHFYIDTVFDAKAYDDIALQIEANQTISQPYTVAFQTQLLDVKSGTKILEVGTGSAYQASVLAYLGAEVYTIERQKKLFEQNKLFKHLSYYSNIKYFYGDGFEGLPNYAPFDRIIITAAAPYIPHSLLQQLTPSGIMVIPVDEGDAQRMLKIIKNSDGTYEEEKYDMFSFVPMLSGKQ